MKRLSLGQRTVIYAAAGLLALAFLGYVAYVLGLRGGRLAEDALGIWTYETVLVGAAASCLARALLVPRERLGWALLALALALYAAAEIYYVIELGNGNEPPTPSPADIGYLGFYPVAYAGLIALVREQLGSFPAIRWLDGLIAGAAVAALAAALALDPIVAASTSGSSLEVAVNLAYPIADLTLLGLVVAVAALSGWRPGASWLMLGAGLLVTGITDVVYLFQAARGTYVEDGALDVAWLLGMLLLAAAAWLPPPDRRRGARASGSAPSSRPWPATAAAGILFAEPLPRDPDRGGAARAAHPARRDPAAGALLPRSQRPPASQRPRGPHRSAHRPQQPAPLLRGPGRATATAAASRRPPAGALRPRRLQDLQRQLRAPGRRRPPRPRRRAAGRVRRQPRGRRLPARRRRVLPARRVHRGRGRGPRRRRGRGAARTRRRLRDHRRAGQRPDPGRGRRGGAGPAARRPAHVRERRTASAPRPGRSRATS